MKKVILAIAVVALFASCKKDYTCTCTETDFDLNGNPISFTSVETYTEVSGSNANLLKTSCESTYTSGSVTQVGCVWDKK
jgi:hypothetical protein